MMVEPPGDARGGRVFEVDDGVVAVFAEPRFIEKRTGAMLEAEVVEGRGRADALVMEAREEGSRAGAIETIVVIQNAAVQWNTFAFQRCNKLSKHSRPVLYEPHVYR